MNAHFLPRSTPSALAAARFIIGVAAIPIVFGWGAHGADCVRWVQRTDVGAPEARAGHVMAYDSDRGVTVIFGGALTPEDPFPGGEEDPGAHLDEVASVPNADGTPSAEYNNPTRLNIPTPPARELHTMAYDSRRRCVVLFGGSRHLKSVYNDTWEYGLGAVPVLFVDGAYSGPRDGSASRPFQTVRAAVAAASLDCPTILSIHAGDYPEGVLSIRKPVRLQCRNGPVRIH